MSTNTRDADSRFPTTGPDSGSYDRYRFETTDDGGVCIRDTVVEGAWIRAAEALALEDCR